MVPVSAREKLIVGLMVTIIVCVTGWAQWTLHAPGPAPGTLDFSETNYPGNEQ